MGECDSVQKLYTDKNSVGLKLRIQSQLSFQIVIIFQAVAWIYSWGTMQSITHILWKINEG